MKKRNIIMITLFAAVGMQQIQAAAPLSWMRGKWQAGVQKTRETVKVKYREVLQKLQSFQSYLNEKGGCILSGTCPPEVKQTLVRRAKILGAALAALAVLLGAAYFFSREESTEPIDLSQQQYRFTPQISIEAIAKKHGEAIPTDNSPSSLLVRGAFGGALDSVKKFTDLVRKNILLTARDVTLEVLNTESDPKKVGVYQQIKNVLNKAIAEFNEFRLRKNLGFINSAVTGLLKEVKTVLCSLQPPSQNAITEALAQLKNKVGYTFDEIKDFLRNPVCPVGK